MHKEFGENGDERQLKVVCSVATGRGTFGKKGSMKIVVNDRNGGNNAARFKR